MEKKRSIELDIKTVYQMLIGDLRYGYTRNNHLMPSDAYDKAKSILDLMDKVDSTWAMNTADQICSECISDQLMWHFYDGLDDEFGSMNEAIEFVKYLISFMQKYKKDYKPYNYSDYEELLGRIKNIKYSVFKLLKEDEFASDNKTEIPDHTQLLKMAVDIDEAYNYLFLDVLESPKCTCNSLSILDKNNRVIGKKFRILSPDSHKDELYIILKEYDSSDINKGE